jgi:hypothetical protein
MIKLARLVDKRIEFFKELSNEEVSTLNSITKRLFDFERDTLEFRLFKNTYNDFQDAIKDHKIQLKLSRIILELMSTFKTFIDHWETSLKREYGKDSAPINSFKAATKKEYDHHFAYRFIYELRNYTQHVNLPSLNFHSSINDKNIVETHIYLNKYDLLKNYTKWKPVIKQDFTSLPENFDFIPLIDDLYDSIKRINDVAINLNDIKNLYFSSKELLKFNSYKTQDNCQIAIIKGYWSKPLPQPLDISVLPLDIAEYIVKNINISRTK